MKTKTILYTSVAVPCMVGIVCMGAFYSEPVTIENVREYVAPAVTIAPLSTVEQARIEVEKIKQQQAETESKLQIEQEKLLSEWAQATSTASDRIAEIEKERDAQVGEIERKLEEINSVRASFI